MSDKVQLAIQAVDRIRRSPGYRELSEAERRRLEQDLRRVEGAFGQPTRQDRRAGTEDPYSSLSLQTGSYGNGRRGNGGYGNDRGDAGGLGRRLPAAAYGGQTTTAPRAPAGGVDLGPRRRAPMARAAATPQDFARDIGGLGARRDDAADPSKAGEAAPAAPPAPLAGATDLFGVRAHDAVDAVDFSGFVRGLVIGTFQAIVDATAQQVRDYAELVSSISRSVDAFSRDNVSDNQARDYLVQQHPRDLRLQLPAPGAEGGPRVLPVSSAEGTSPDWLDPYGLAGESLTEELTEGALLRAARPKLGEQRMQTLATMVLMGINRIVVEEGNVRAKMQFHASAVESRTAELAQLTAAETGGIGGRQVPTGTGATMISTMKANAQADASVRADLMGEVNIRFRTETFPLERFADSPAIQLINRHARWQAEPAAAAAPVQASAQPGSSAPAGPSRGGA